ncbi:MAG: 4Fe-4S dicluster domain-containing protein [Clostridia bacterium]
MKRKVIHIHEDKCNGCGLCVTACHEGALKIIDGKARLVSESYCDGLGDCLPKCPLDAIELIEKEALPFDEEAVKKNMALNQACPSCPGTRLKTNPDHDSHPRNPVPARAFSRLKQWPCQLKLVPSDAPYFEGARLLVAADCTAYAYAGLHEEFMKDKITLIGCPKLDDTDYSVKLTEILRLNNIRSVTLVRMQVPCCGGLSNALKKALVDSGKMIPWNIFTITTNGEILED